MIKLKMYYSFLLVIIIGFSLCGCIQTDGEYKKTGSAIDIMVSKISIGMNESDFCEYYIDYFDDEQYIDCHGETGYYSILSERVLLVGYTTEHVIKAEQINNYIYYYFMYIDERIDVGYVAEYDIQHIYGIE